MIDGRRGQTKRDEAVTEGDSPVSTVEAPRPRFQLGTRLHRRGVTADQITLLGLVLAAGTAAAIGTGWLVLGVGLIIVGGLMDALDGAVAKAAGSCSKRGAFFDSTADRVADGLIFGGVAWYFVVGHHPKLALLPFAILAAGNIVSYERAKAESLGYSGKGGLMERAERLILLGVALFVHWVMIELLWLLLGLTVLTAVWRFGRIWAQATAELRGADPAAAAAAARWRPARVESRWREWRQAALGGTTTGAAGRRADTPASRWRARRNAEPIATRVRRVLQAERTGTRAARTGRPPRVGPSDRMARQLRRRYTSR
jgi:CDP-diacylglycerol--glycerol-3-phosphate 3-phosphatidyltransferase